MEEVAGALGLSSIQNRELLSRLARKKLITRIQRGLYLVPSRLPPGGQWRPSDFVVIDALMTAQRGKYQICGPAAFLRYGWETQIPERLCIYNNRLSGERRIGVTSLTLIKVSNSRLGDTESFKTPDGAEVFYSSRARSLIDAIDDWSRFGGLPRAYGWIRREFAANEKISQQLVACALKYGNIGARKRLGQILESLGASETLLARLEASIP